MKAILKSVEGRGPETCLQATILRALELADSQALIGYVYRTDRNRSEIAALSKLVFDAAEAEDIVRENDSRAGCGGSGGIGESGCFAASFFKRKLCAGFDWWDLAASTGVSCFVISAVATITNRAILD